MRSWGILCLVVSLFSATPGIAKELEGNPPAMAKGRDWLYVHREAWDIQRRSLDTPSLYAWVEANPNSFFEAAFENTAARRADEYGSIRQRQSYYDFMALSLEAGKNTPPLLKDIKFFHATTSITIQSEVGLTESLAVNFIEQYFPSLAKKFGVTTGSIELLTRINARLFEQNMGVIDKLLNKWHEPRDPRSISPRTKLSALDFDLAMVEFEQQAVEEVITATGTSDASLDDINTMIRKNKSPLSAVKLVEPWVSKAGFSQRDFKSAAWRVAVGRALVFHFHKQSEAAYLAYMTAHPTTIGKRQTFYDALNASETETKGVDGSFAIVGSWLTERGAMRHLTSLRGKNRAIHGAVYPPYGKSKYWTVVMSSFASPDSANELAARARSSGVAKDAFTIKWRAVDPLGRPFRPHPASLSLGDTTNLIQDALDNVGDPDRNSMVSVFSAPDQSSAEAWLKQTKARFPDIELALVQSGAAPIYKVALAVHANRTEAEHALELARRIGVPSDQVVREAMDPKEVVQKIGSYGTRSTAAWETVGNCYKQGKVSVAELHACSGYWLTSTTLTRCLLESDCRVLSDELLATNEQRAAFLSAQGLTLESKLTMLVQAVPVPLDAQTFINQVEACRNGANGQQPAFIACLTKNGALNAQTLNCFDSSRPNEDVLKCVSQGAGLPMLAWKPACFQNDYSDQTQLAKCLMSPDASANLTKAETCLASKRTTNSVLSDCMSGLLPPEQAKVTGCLSRPDIGKSEATACFLPPGEAAKAKRAFDCIQQAGGDKSKVALCVANVANADAAKVSACIAANENAMDTTTCLLKDRPELQSAHDAYECVAGGADAAALIANCSGDAVSQDAKDLARCVSKFSDDNGKLSGCAAAALLPPDWAPLAECAATSEGAVGVALCLAAPNMNDEWRIAAECASSSGGEPMTFAGCTAGRLTVRELQKCLTGQIGKDCFGPNNTIIAAYATVGKDLSNCLNGQACLGPNNDLVKAADELSKGVQHVGEEAQRIINTAFGQDSDWCRGDLTKWTC